MRRASAKGAAGFTIVELLVVIAVIALLVQLMLPALIAARESVRRVQCQNNMRQLVLAIDNYHSTHRRYPPGRFLGRYGEGPDSRAWSWMAMILPQIETDNLYDKGNVPNATLRESGIADQHISLFICPSFPGDLGQPRVDAGNLIGFRVGHTTYKGVSGANWGADESLDRDDVGSVWRNEGTNGSFDGLRHGDGILWRSDYKRRMRQAHIKDGLSNTFLVGEDLPRHNIWCSWPYSNNAYGTCAIPPNNNASRTSQYDSYSFRSAHPGGLNFGFAGGAVKFIRDDISLDVYRALATRDGSEQVDMNDL